MNKLYNLKLLTYLLALHEKQHFGRAAAACYVSQSTLSAAVAQLEEILEIPLLERNHKNFLFTPAGEEVVRRSRSIIAQSQELVDYALSQQEPLQGTFYLGVIPTIAPFLVPELLTQCKKKFPKLQLFVREETTENVVSELHLGRLDMIILALPYHLNDLHLEILIKDKFQLVLPKNWEVSQFTQDMGRYPFQSIFLLEKEHCLSDHAIQACSLKDTTKVNPFHATSLHTLIQMVDHHPGITFLPTLAINSGLLKGTQLRAISLPNQNAYREIGVAWRKTAFRISVYQHLGQLVKNILANKCSA
ncbi:MAG: LysR family transcriptional regulator [Legionella sp. 40-6]|nr:LysR family transcriptional regulator [Legionella sp.]OJY35945.1 MAG: LysR family transcriptional regulator [Legionella sp. 40-6]